MMTTMAALLGGVPLMLGHGTGSELRQPLGYTMVGGLIVSQALTLFTTPVVYLYLDRLSHWLSGSKAKAPRAEPERGIGGTGLDRPAGAASRIGAFHRQQRQRPALARGERGGIDDALSGAAQRGIERSFDGKALFLAMQDIFDRLAKGRFQNIDREYCGIAG